MKVNNNLWYEFITWINKSYQTKFQTYFFFNLEDTHIEKRTALSLADAQIAKLR